MSRYCCEKNVTPILAAAEYWKVRVLLGEQSVFGDNAVWTTPNIQAFHTAFTQSPDDGDRPFLEKLKDQLSDQAPEVKQLAAEALWLLLLAPSNTSPDKKRENVAAVWNWSGVPWPSNSASLSNDTLSGIGSAGPAFGNHRARELTFLLNFLLQFRSLEISEQTDLLGDPWKFAHWLQMVPDAAARQFRHMLLYLLFPDDFERTFSAGDRRAVAEFFSDLPRSQIGRLSAVELDELLRKTRIELEVKYGTKDLDYYCDPLKGHWWRDLKSATEKVTAEHVHKALDEIDREGVPSGAQSSTYDLVFGAKRYPPKLVLSLAVKHATGAALSRSMFAGGDDTPAFKILRDLGFSIVPKAGLSELISRFLEQAGAGQDLRTKSYAGDYRDLQIKVGFGQGTQSRVPWIAFLAPDQKVSEGIYPVLLYYRDAQLLVLAYGISEENEPAQSWGITGLPSVGEYLQDKIDQKAERYGSSLFEAAYEIPDKLDVKDLVSRLDTMIDKYKSVVAEYAPVSQESQPAIKYGREEALDDAFISAEFYERVISGLENNKNIILQGPPGVGKTFVARRIADAFVGEAESNRVKIIQFHASYSYEDFVQGFRPSANGGFERRNGIFYRFRKEALDNPGQKFVLIIDEINRANLSKVFGELLMLIEKDKRKPRYAAQLAYFTEDDLPFFVPENLFIIGLMNTADRSLALVDYALRRRFEFFDIEPAFNSGGFATLLSNSDVPKNLISHIQKIFSELNSEISKDQDLGKGYQIGHSYFCDLSGDENADTEYANVIERQILPLLKEYWFEGTKVDNWRQKLLLK